MSTPLHSPPAGSQPDHNSYIQGFLNWCKSPETFRIGCAGYNDEEKRKYIPLEKLRARLTRKSVEDLLAALFDSGGTSAPDANVIIKHYLRPFAILLLIGEGKMIYQFVNHKSLKDDQLPHLQEPSQFPSSTQRDIWVAFRQEQWKFCALTLEYSMGLHIEPDDILPIRHKEKIAKGGSSITYKITVDREYDKLVPQEHEDSNQTNDSTYVLKTYQTAEAQTYYDNERDAFNRLKEDGMPPSNIIGFYGAFVCQEMYNIILEYAEHGNLDYYVEQTQPPLTTQEKMTFWENFLPVINGLVKIHGEGEDDPEILQPLLGWHQDVTPSNILVKSRGDGSYDCDFKLADLGLSHFEKHLCDLRNVSTQENFGTSTYAAPEARRYDEKLQKCNLKIKQNVDIWSLSCVFSEVATWVNKGWTQLAEYRNRRIQEMERRIRKSEDCFHDGFEVLTAVAQSHDDIVASRRPNDPITPKILDLIRDMLLIKAEQRPNAIYTYHKSIRIISEARSEIRPDESLALGAKSSARPTLTDGKRPPLKNPPNLPPNHERRRSGEATFGQGLYVSSGTLFPEGSPTTEDNGRVFGGSSRSSWQSRVYPDTHDEPYDKGVSTTAYPFPVRPRSGQHGYSGRGDRGHLSSHDRYNQRHDAHTSFPHVQNNEAGQDANDNDPPSDLSEMNHIAVFNQASLGHTTQNRSSQALYGSNSDYKQEDSSYGGPRKGILYSVAPNSHSATASGTLRPNETLNTPSRGLAAPQNRRVGTPLPEMSVEEGLSLKRQGRRFPREDLFMELKARDHVFLVDNAESMKDHRNELEEVLELLWAMVAKQDPDGAELYISTDMKALKPRTDARMLEELQSRPAKDAPDMRHCFGQIIEKYQNRLGKRNIKSKVFHWNTTPARGPRKLSLYVLTDGIWQSKTDLRQVIRTLVEHLIEHKLTNKQVGIQFIQFGNNERGRKRLEELDLGLKLDLDIIDTIPANGSVWKMLLGPVNDTYDDDPNDDDSENENETEMRHGYQNNNAAFERKGKARDRWR